MPSCPPGLRAAPYLLCDSAGTLYQLPLGVAVRGAHLEGPRLLHQEDAAVAQVLYASANLEADLWRQVRGGEAHRGHRVWTTFFCRTEPGSIAIGDCYLMVSPSSDF